MPVAIEVSSLSKKFRINHADLQRGKRYRTLRESLASAGRNFLGNLRGGAALGHVEDFLALRDISFNVDEGEVVGIIGRNGAGKSTLLKILTRISEPTGGKAVLRGRVGSLLEVGTGFHPELTGRENVLLNGSILGMSRREIKDKFDAIVDFSGVANFIDTPVKRYSSGMKVRLGFAVAAHLDLEILLIDEVLAVGDVDFQRRCLGKMSDVAQSGRTVLFVSHHMAALERLCKRTILINAGTIEAEGETSDVISQYIGGFNTTAGARDLRKNGNGVVRSGGGAACVDDIAVFDQRGNATESIPMGEGMMVRVGITAYEAVRSAALQVSILSDKGDIYCRVNSFDTRNWTFPLDAREKVHIECSIPKMNLGPNRHLIHIQLLDPVNPIDTVEHAVSFEVVPRDVFNTGRTPYGHNILFLAADWKCERQS